MTLFLHLGCQCALSGLIFQSAVQPLAFIGRAAGLRDRADLAGHLPRRQ